MYIVTIKNGAISTEIQNEHHKLHSGKVVQGINVIDSFTFSVLPNNPAFGTLNEFTTLVSVYNTARGRYEFLGRVLHSTPSMSESGLLSQEATCESYLGFLCDSQQGYVATQNWTVTGLLTHIINYHNSRVEAYKQFKIGTVTVTDPNNNLYCGIQRKNTWETIKEKLIGKLGGELRFRAESDGLYIDYVKEIGEEKTTTIALSKNMKSIRKEKDPSDIITRLIPLGSKLGEDTEERLDITSVNNGLNYIDDTVAIAEYGLHEGIVEFDGVTEPSILLTKGKAWLKENNKVSVKYVITALDLSLIGLDIDDFERGNYHPITNSLLGIDDTARINKKNIDVCNDTESSFEIGESFKTLSELQREQNASIGKTNEVLNDTRTEITRNYVTNEKLVEERTHTQSLIEQSESKIMLAVSTDYVTKEGLGEAVASVVITSDQILAAVSEKVITTETLKDYATNDSVDTKLSSYSTTTEMNSAISAKADEITLATSKKFESYSTTAEMNSAISAKADEISLSTSKTLESYATIDGVDDKLSNYSTTEKMNSAITLKGDEITLATSKTLKSYATNDSVDTKLSSYSTTAEMNSAISAKADEISLSTSQTLASYYTKAQIDNKFSVNNEGITAQVSAQMQNYVTGKLALTIETNTDGSKHSKLAADVNKIVFNAGEIEINSSNFSLDTSGHLTTNSATIGGWTLATYTNSQFTSPALYASMTPDDYEGEANVFIHPEGVYGEYATGNSAGAKFRATWLDIIKIVSTAKSGYDGQIVLAGYTLVFQDGLLQSYFANS